MQLAGPHVLVFLLSFYIMVVSSVWLFLIKVGHIIGQTKIEMHASSMRWRSRYEYLKANWEKLNLSDFVFDECHCLLNVILSSYALSVSYASLDLSLSYASLDLSVSYASLDLTYCYFVLVQSYLDVLRYIHVIP